MNSSFTPSVREWNKLENSVRNLDIPLKFKRALLNNANEINIVPKHFMYGPRKLNVILTQLRCSASILNNDLFKSNIVSSPKCYVVFLEEMHFTSSLNVVNTPILGVIC